jgi:HPt (histidine-containing phosphotransfer) domain-containing protein
MMRPQATRGSRLEMSAESEFVPSGADPLVDVNQYLNMYQKLGERYVSILGKFDQNSQQLIARLQQAIRDRALEEIALAAHTLKGSSAAVGAQQLSKQAVKMEALVGDNDLGAAQGLIEQMQLTLSQTLQEFERLLGEQRKMA